MVSSASHTSERSTFLDKLKERILVLDGAMGTMIQALKLDEEGYRGARFDAWNREVRGNNDLLNLSRPDAVRDIHLAYFRAGADIVSTNTFSSTTIAQADYGMEGIAYELNLRRRDAGARGGARGGEGRRQAAASSPARSARPTARPRSRRTSPIPASAPSPSTSCARPTASRCTGLIDGGADLLLIETIFDTLNAKAAIYAIAEVCEERGVDVPVMISGTITDRSGRLLSGQTPEAFWNSVRHANPVTVGLNCALGAQEMRAHIAEIGRVADTFVCAYPNAGLPNEFGYYDESPEFMAELLGEFADGRPRQHRRRLLRHHAGAHRGDRQGGRRQDAARDSRDCRASFGCRAWKPFTLTPEIPFVNVGERTNVTGSAKFRKLITAGDYTAALSIAREQVENGAQVIDVNMDEGLLDSKQAMVTFLNLIAAEPDIARVPVMVDSSKFSVIEAGLKCLQGKPVVNSISMKEGEDAFIEHAKIVRRYGAAVVVMAFDEKGQADTFERKTAICKRAYDILDEQGRLPARGHHLRSEHLRHRHRHGGAQRLRRRLHRGGALDQGEPAARACLGRRVEPVVLVPRQRARARGDALGVPVSRHQGRHGHGHRQCRADGGLRRSRSGIARGLRGRGAQPPPRCRRAAARARRQIPRRRAGGQGSRSRLARAAGREAAGARAGARHHRLHRGRRRGGAARAPSARST